MAQKSSPVRIPRLCEFFLALIPAEDKEPNFSHVRHSWFCRVGLT
jgi:hypothetical protein